MAGGFWKSAVAAAPSQTQPAASRRSSSKAAATMETAPFKVLVLGGCYAGLAATTNLLDLCAGRRPRFPSPPSATEVLEKIPVEVTIVDERDGYYHLIGTPLSFASREYADKAWVKFEDVAALKSAGVRCVQGSVVAVDPEKKTATIEKAGSKERVDEGYDFLVVATGLRRAQPAVPESLTKKAYLHEAETFIKAAEDARERVVVIGGGAVGIEMAAELKTTVPTQSVHLVHSRDKLLSAEPLPDDFKDVALATLRDAGVDVTLGKRVLETVEEEEEETAGGKGKLFRLKLSDGSELAAGHVLHALSHSAPSSAFLPPAALDADGYVKIAPTLNFKGDGFANAGDHFAVGDVAAWSGIRRCGGAMHMGHYAGLNVYQRMLQRRDPAREPKLVEISEFPPVIGLAVGKKAACYSAADGIKAGEEALGYMFGDDLGWSICWKYMKLGEPMEAAN